MVRGARIGLAATALALAASPAHAYDFWLHADSIGQAYQLRDFQLVGPDLILGRRIVTQTLALRITDIGDFGKRRRRARLPDRGLRISWQSYVRVTHDFGNYTSGQLTLPGPTERSALDVIPELAYDVTGIELMYGYLSLEGLVDDRLTIDVGRTLADDGWGTTAIDGARARFDVPALPVEVSAQGGLRVRANSPLGVPAYELDGTSGARCQEYVKGPTPGTGSWQLIDRNNISDIPLASDYQDCPQREVDQPSIGVTLATHGTRDFSAEIGYRRTWSSSAEIYPDEFGQLPSSGVDEERVFARAHGDVHAGSVTVEPYGDVRYSIVNGVFDRADAGVRVKVGNSTIEPAVDYFYPTFDADSIFNAFSIDPTTDVRLTYAYDPRTTWRATADAWLRKYTDLVDGVQSYAVGGDAGLQRTLGRTWRASVSALADGGYGGWRVGGTASGQWRPTQLFWLRGTVGVLDVDEDPTAGLGSPHYVSGTANLSSTYRVAEWAAVHVIGEGDRDAIYGTQLRVLAVLDLAFMPEM